MADDLPSTPPSHSEKLASEQHAQSSPDELTSRLDELLQQYLELLDEHTKLREELGKAFSNGFYSLAQAQYSSTRGPGRRYGQEGYDERMKASRRVEVREKQQQQEGHNTDALSIPTGGKTPHLSGQTSYTFHTTKYEPDDTTQSVTKGHEGLSSEKESQNNTASTHDSVAEKPLTQTTKPDPAYRDPATWFGILIPQPLRQSQKWFVGAVETTIPGLVTTRLSLEALEQEIWRVRAALGIEKEYHHDSDSSSIKTPLSSSSSPSAAAAGDMDSLSQNMTRSSLVP